MPTLSRWSVCRLDDNAYLAPELGAYGLIGVVAGHPRKLDGTLVQTSRIVSAQGSRVTTEHTVYELADPDPEWLTWLTENGYVFDPEDPARPKRAEATE